MYKRQDINRAATNINGVAGRILAEARPINDTAGDINTTAARINRTAGAIDAVATRINNSAGAIALPATGILDIALLVDRDANAINDNLDRTISVANDIQNDTKDIIEQALDARDTSACIDRNVGGEENMRDDDCQGRE